MRIILVFFQSASPEAVHGFLDELCPTSDTPRWLFPSPERPVLYISPYAQKYWLMELAEDEEMLKTLFPYDPTYSLAINISGRVNGRPELFQFLEVLTSRFDCFMMDDYTDYAWHFAEIKNGVLIQNHPFFDFEGWHFNP